MTHETLAEYERYADHLEDLRRADAAWSHDEQWMEALVMLCRDSGDSGSEQYLRNRLLCARLQREVATRKSLADLRIIPDDV